MAADLSSSYFQLFGLPRSFEIDAAQLDSRYRELQRIVHPDRYVNAGDQERRLAMQQATRINEGYQTLKDPLSAGATCSNWAASSSATSTTRPVTRNFSCGRWNCARRWAR